MDDSFAKRISAASVAGWWTALVVWLLMVVSWGAYLLLMHARPAWLLTMLGGHVDWAGYQTMYLWLFGAFKMGAFLLLTVVIWLSLWARRLKRAC